MACVVVPYAYVNELLNYPRTVKKFELVFVMTQKGEFVFLIMHITHLTPHLQVVITSSAHGVPCTFVLRIARLQLPMVRQARSLVLSAVTA